MDGAGSAPALIVTLGCRLNTADSALIATRLAGSGYRVVESTDTPALIVINSCAVTAEAVRKTRQLIRRLRREHPTAEIVVTGCAVDAAASSLAGDGGDLLLPNREKALIAARLTETGDMVPETAVGGPVFSEGVLSSFPFRSRAFIKIQEGCDNFCSYCIVPHLRGRERSRAFDEVIADCRQAIAAGFPEVVLTGVNTCAYRDGTRGLGDVVRAIGALPGEFRIRLSSTEPHPDNLALLEAMAKPENRVCRFLHLSLQHGSDRILKRMNRHYTTREYADFVRDARERIPGIHLGSDLIVGFPGETEEDFAESCRFVESMEFANLHIFTYSPRAGTPAAALPGRIPPDVAKERHKRLDVIARESKRRFIAGQYGRKLPVIFERVDSDGTARGWSDNYIELRVPAREVPLDRIVPVEATAENTASNLIE